MEVYQTLLDKYMQRYPLPNRSSELERFNDVDLTDYGWKIADLWRDFMDILNRGFGASIAIGDYDGIHKTIMGNKQLIGHMSITNASNEAVGIKWNNMKEWAAGDVIGKEVNMDKFNALLDDYGIPTVMGPIKAPLNLLNRYFFYLRKRLVDSLLSHLSTTVCLISNADGTGNACDIVAMGSSKINSDYDVNADLLNGPRVMDAFGDITLALFGDHSSIIFDTNLYLTGYLRRISNERPDTSNKYYYKRIHNDGKSFVYVYRRNLTDELAWSVVKVMEYLEEIGESDSASTTDMTLVAKFRNKLKGHFSWETALRFNQCRQKFDTIRSEMGKVYETYITTALLIGKQKKQAGSLILRSGYRLRENVDKLLGDAGMHPEMTPTAKLALFKTLLNEKKSREVMMDDMYRIVVKKIDAIRSGYEEDYAEWEEEKMADPYYRLLITLMNRVGCAQSNDLTAAIVLASLLSRETYNAFGPLAHVLGELQIGIPSISEFSEMQARTRDYRENIRENTMNMTEVDYLCSIIENFGDCIKELIHFNFNTIEGRIRGVIFSCKYLYRLLDGIQRIFLLQHADKMNIDDIATDIAKRQNIEDIRQNLRLPDPSESDNPRYLGMLAELFHDLIGIDITFTLRGSTVVPNAGASFDLDVGAYLDKLWDRYVGRLLSYYTRARVDALVRTYNSSLDSLFRKRRTNPHSIHRLHELRRGNIWDDDHAVARGGARCHKYRFEY